MTSTLISDDFNTNKVQHNLSDPHSSGTKEYYVKEDDTLHSIAVKFDITVSKLSKFNKLSSNVVFPGQILVIPPVRNKLLSGANESKIVSPVTDSLEQKNFGSLTILPISSTIEKPFQDLVIVSTVNEHADIQEETNILSNNSYTYKSCSVSSENKYEIISAEKKSEELIRNRIFSNESSQSETLEENFVKMCVNYITSSDEMVRGVLLITPTSIMFDPDPTCTPVVEQGCEKFGMLCNLVNITSIAVYKDTQLKKVNSVTSQCTYSNKNINRSDDIDNNDDRMLSKPHDVTGGSSDNCEEAVEVEEGNKLMFEFPFIHTLIKTVEDYLPGVTQYAEVKVRSDSSDLPERKLLYFCMKSNIAMVKTFSSVQLDGRSDDAADSDEVRECWFQFLEDRAEQLFSFFMQWSPDSYTLDFAEQNGFVDAESVVKKTNEKPVDIIKKEADEARTRTCTDSSLHFIEDYFADKEVKKEWELVSPQEAERRAKLNANDLANDDSSLMPEMMDKSNLIKEEIVLELCRHIPARCVGCPWKLLYSTFEHGTSLRTLYRRVKENYDDTPAALIIQDSNNHLFGVFCSSSPRMSDHFFGSGESFLFTIHPNFEVFKWTGENSFFIKGDGDALMFGGGDGTAGLWLDGDLRHGRSKRCYTFDNSILSSDEDFFITDLEVWGFDNS